MASCPSDSPHIISFYSNVLGPDLLDPKQFRDTVTGWVIAVDLEQLTILAKAVQTPGSEVWDAMTPKREGSDVEFQAEARIKRGASVSRKVGLRADQLGLPMSPREVAQQRTLQKNWDQALHKLKWEAGSKDWRIRKGGEFATDERGRRAKEWARQMQALGIPLAAGPSGTTNAMMNVAVVFRADLHDARLACIGFLPGYRRHSLVEILAAAEPFGPTYDKSRRMYRNIKPLDEAELRSYGDGKFPDEAKAPGKGSAE
ncbi:hypothetical protein [Actinophytocola xanthii]|uniref:Uncharacterized protein n=1 Tax=Actinophytocola xanthii TaxID=1912961 RepID=A0A1Q8CTI0_9PSEU|nr:hypothetical protein [Actinophytocola xanthii]OLF17669.1 hypothetical protein BU204_10690 [Actinophytocola xanthii]